MKRVLFFRDFRGLQGGHLKVWDYFQHVRATPGYEACIRFSDESLWDRTNPWLPLRAEVDSSWKDGPPDLLFLAGLDWERIAPAARSKPSTPVINLIQSFRHAHPGGALRQFLHHPAVRICVSEELRSAIADTGEVNGPLVTIPNGIELPPLPERPRENDWDLLIVGMKQPELARQLAKQLARPTSLRWLRSSREEPRVQLLVTSEPRERFLELLRLSTTALFLPQQTEGFYLPALEAMALGTLVICPDVVGNRSFCLPGENSFRPPFASDALVAATRAALRLSESERERLLTSARHTAAQHTLGEERARFVEILTRMASLWPSVSAAESARSQDLS